MFNACLSNFCCVAELNFLAFCRADLCVMQWRFSDHRDQAFRNVDLMRGGMNMRAN
jgi:hypothetical protein